MEEKDLRFIYVFGDDGRDAMLAKGYKLAKSNGNGVHVFFNKADMNFENIGVKCVMSDTLTF